MKSKCKHGFDVACLMCGFGEFEGKRVWFDWAWQEQQKQIDELESQLKDLLSFENTRNKAEENIKNGARLTNHRINLGGDE
ncbi:hypothetical protein [Acinetobacter sp. ANC 4640]